MANAPNAAAAMNEIINSMWDEEVGQILTDLTQKMASYQAAVQELNDIIIDVKDAYRRVKPEERAGWEVFIQLMELETKLVTCSANQIFAKYSLAEGKSSEVKDGLMGLCSRVAAEAGFVMTQQLLRMARRIAARHKTALLQIENEYEELNIMQQISDLISEGQKKLLGFEN